MRPISSIKRLLVFSPLILTLSLCFLVFCELLAPAFAPAFYTQPYLFLILYLVPCSSLLLILTRYDLRQTRLTVMAAYLIPTFVIFASPVDSRRPFFTALYSVQQGMQVWEVQKIMASYSYLAPEFGTNWQNGKLVVQNGESLVYIHGGKSLSELPPEYNAERGVIKFRNNLVTGIEVSLD